VFGGWEGQEADSCFAKNTKGRWPKKANEPFKEKKTQRCPQETKKFRQGPETKKSSESRFRKTGIDKLFPSRSPDPEVSAT